MRMEVLRLQDLRNYTSAEFEPAPTTTLLVGPNGSGKSSLLEAAGLFSTLSTSRASSLRMVVRDGCEEGGAHLETGDRASLEIRIRSGRAVLRDGGSSVASRDFLGRFRSVLFTPEDLDLVRGEPSLRRSALDALCVQVRPRYRAMRKELERALRQRNAALREGLGAQAALFGEAVVVAAAPVLEARREVIGNLGPAAVQLYSELAETGTISLAYVDTSESEGLSGAGLVEHLRKTYERLLGTDLERGRTTVGPHRDDLDLELDGRPARWFASRGEQRSITLAFRLAELHLMPEAVLMLDDVLSELDPERRRRVFEVTEGAQTIVTATDRDTVPPGAKVESVWRVEAGSLTKEEG